MNSKRRENFRRIASARTNEVLARLRILGNCANRSSYDYTEEEINKIFSEVEKKIKEVKAKFTFPNRDSKFKLQLCHEVPRLFIAKKDRLPKKCQ